MAPDSRVFVTGPDVVRSVTGEDVDMASLGGPETHHKKSGVCHIVADDELDAYARGRRLVGLFCQQGHFDRSKAEAGDTDIHALLPESPRRASDVHPTRTRPSTNFRPTGHRPWWSGSAGCPAAASVCWPITHCAWAAA
jgi:acetyl-CoA/propionyl-CoA carboxylase carboxyl transferase subunit